MTNEPTSGQLPWTIRRAMIEHAQAAFDVRHAHELAGDQTSSTTIDQFVAAWQALGSQLADRAWIAVLPNGSVPAYAELLRLDDVFMAQLWSPPNQSNADMLVALIAHAEQQACDIGQDEGLESVHLFAQATSFHPDIEQAITQSGFDTTSTYEQMDLAVERAPMSPENIPGIEIRPFDVERDAKAVYLADEEAFQDQRGHTPRTFEQWQERLNIKYEGEKPSLSQIARTADDIAGAALVEVIAGVGWIHHLGVRRPWRRRGLGQALMLSALGSLYEHGVGSARLNVDADSLTNAHLLYRRLGFRPTHRYTNFQKIVALT